VPDESPNDAAWITDGLRSGHPNPDLGGEWPVGSLLPAGFDHYLRIFHRFEDGNGHFTRWSERAAAALVQYHSQLSERALGRVIRSFWSDAPWWAPTGLLDKVSRSALCRGLDSWVDGQPVFMYFGISVQVYGEDEFVIEQPIIEMIDTDRILALMDGKLVESPQLIWPKDRSWIVCVDYDLTSTYVACDLSLARMLQSHPDLEILETSLDERVDYRMDTINCGIDGLSLGPPLG